MLVEHTSNSYHIHSRFQQDEHLILPYFCIYSNNNARKRHTTDRTLLLKSTYSGRRSTPRNLVLPSFKMNQPVIERDWLFQILADVCSNTNTSK